MNAFWKTVNGFEPQLKRKFIKFVTGVDTLPLTGTEFLRIEMPFTAISVADHEKCLQMLPQAHWSTRADMDWMARLQLLECLVPNSKDGEDAVTKVGESYDSLGLPALSEGQSAADLTTENVSLSPQTSKTEQGEAEPVEPEVKPEPTTLSPRPDESYEEDYDDWEEESMA
eukprot:jgi/Phyca11/20743/fgenesh1_pg.PHYCAscaffold_72_\